MIHIEVVTEARVVRTVQGSMAVDLEAGRSKVSRLLVGHQPKGQQQYRVPFSCLFGAGFGFGWAYWAIEYTLGLTLAHYQEFSTIFKEIGIS